MGRFQTSIELAKSSWAVLRKDKQLAAIPVLSFFVTVAVTAVMGGAVYLTFKTVPATVTVVTSPPARPPVPPLQPTPVTYVVGVLAYIVITFAVTFFTAAAGLVVGAYQRLTGSDPTLGSASAWPGPACPRSSCGRSSSARSGCSSRRSRADSAWSARSSPVASTWRGLSRGWRSR